MAHNESGIDCPECNREDWLGEKTLKHAIVHPHDLPFAVNYSTRIDNPEESFGGLMTAAFLAGKYTYYHAFEIKAKGGEIIQEPESQFSPSTGTVIRRTVSPECIRMLVVGENNSWICNVSNYLNANSVYVTLLSSGQDVADSIEKDLRELVKIKPIEKDNPRISPTAFWYRTATGYSKNIRPIDVPTWEDIRRNYSEVALPKMDKLVRVSPETVNSRLLLLHGAPGSGKTHYLAALSSEWRSWCSMHYIMDPEVLFNDSGYLMETMLGNAGTTRRYIPDDDDDDDDDLPRNKSKNKWRLIVLEDTGELIRADAKERTGQALSRLLNVADGMLGQGTRMIVAITTNEPIRELHEAVVRNGRALATIEIGAIPYAQAQRWIGTEHKLEHRDYTLADLYFLRNGGELSQVPDEPVGMFL